MKIFIAILVSCLPGTAYATEMPTEAQVCTACHGALGQGTAQGPKLAGLSETYISAQVANFIAGRRQNPIMSAVAQGYTDTQVLGQISAYFASQGVTPRVQIRGQQLAVSQAERLYYEGDMVRGLPACYSCHGPSAMGGGPFPRLAGQQAAYIKEQLQAWQQRRRSGDPDDMMGNLAQRLNQDEITDLASYLAGIR